MLQTYTITFEFNLSNVVKKSEIVKKKYMSFKSTSNNSVHWIKVLVSYELLTENGDFYI